MANTTVRGALAIHGQNPLVENGISYQCSQGECRLSATAAHSKRNSHIVAAGIRDQMESLTELERVLAIIDLFDKCAPIISIDVGAKKSVHTHLQEAHDSDKEARDTR